MSHGPNSKSSEVAENLSAEFNMHSIRCCKSQIILLHTRSQGWCSPVLQTANHAPINPNFCKHVCLLIYSLFIFHSIIFSPWQAPSKSTQCFLSGMLFWHFPSESYGKGFAATTEREGQKYNQLLHVDVFPLFFFPPSQMMSSLKFFRLVQTLG